MYILQNKEWTNEYCKAYTEWWIIIFKNSTNSKDSLDVKSNLIGCQLMYRYYVYKLNTICFSWSIVISFFLSHIQYA